MKQVLSLLASATLGITACSTRTASPVGMAGGGKMEPMAELAVGTLQLDGTAQAVTKEQAAELLPLWQVYQEISMSDTAAQDEIDGLVEQIKVSMSEAQWQAISDMKLTQENVMEIMRERGPSMGGAGGSGGGSSRGGFGGEGFPGGGIPPGEPGGMPPDAEIAMGGAGGGTQGMATPQAGATQFRGRQSGVPASVLNAVIEYLKDKAAS